VRMSVERTLIVVDPYRYLADRFPLHDCPIVRSHGGDARGQALAVSGGTALFWSCDFLRRCSASELSVAIPMDLRYPWGGNFAAAAGMKEEGGQTPLIAICVALILIGSLAFFAVLLRLV
jgi:hypothetical protein